MKPNHVKLLLVLLLPGMFLASNSFAKNDKKTEQSISANSVVETATDKTAKKASKAEKQKARALSKRPKVVGKEKLDKEAKGLRKLSKQAIKNWREGRLNPDFSTH